MRANFEFLNKLGVDKWCFHDRDIAPDGATLEVIMLSDARFVFDVCVPLYTYLGYLSSFYY